MTRTQCGAPAQVSELAKVKSFPRVFVQQSVYFFLGLRAPHFGYGLNSKLVDRHESNQNSATLERTMTRPTLLAALTLAVIPCALAQKETFQISPDKSQVQFSLPATLHEVHGTFHVTSGIIAISPGKGEMGGAILVDAHSGSSGEASRDKKMTQDQLKADQYTTVSFAPKSYAGNLAAEGDSDITVQGVFTLLGTPHDLSVPMHIHIDHGACTAKGSFAVPFVKWGVKDPSTFMLKVGKEVKVDLDLSGTLSLSAS